MIQVNQTIEVVVEAENTANLYHSRIEEVTDTELLFALPYYHGLPVFFCQYIQLPAHFCADPDAQRGGFSRHPSILL